MNPTCPRAFDPNRAAQARKSRLRPGVRSRKNRIHESARRHPRCPGAQSDPSQIAGEALELAIKEWEAGLPTASLPDDPGN